MSVCVMYVCHERCMSVIFGVRSLGILRCSVPARRRNVDLGVSMAVRSCIFGLDLLPCGSPARMASVGGMWYVGVVEEMICNVSRLFFLDTPVSKRGARCVKSLLE